MILKTKLLCLGCFTYSLASYGQGVAVLGNAGTTVKSLQLSLIADRDAGLRRPADIGINPLNPKQLFVVNHLAAGAVVLELADSATPSLAQANMAAGPGSSHFMPRPAGIAFADNGFFATAHDMDKITQPTTPADFMGPSLWTQEYFDGGHASHKDMMHNSPASAGVAWIHGNAYVVNDGYHGALAVYDFRQDHGYGGDDHSDGVMLRYADKQLKNVKDVVAHVVFDRATGIAYAVDSGNNRIVSIDLGLDLTSQDGFDYVRVKNADFNLESVIEPNYDGSVQRLVQGAPLKTLVDGAAAKLATPAGIALYKNVLYVSDNAKSQILAFDLSGQLLDSLDLSKLLPEVASAGLAGIEFDAEGRLYIVDQKNDRLYLLYAGE